MASANNNKTKIIVDTEVIKRDKFRDLLFLGIIKQTIGRIKFATDKIIIINGVKNVVPTNIEILSKQLNVWYIETVIGPFKDVLVSAATIIGAKSIQKAIKDKSIVIIVMRFVVVNAKFLFSLVGLSVIEVWGELFGATFTCGKELDLSSRILSFSK